MMAAMARGIPFPSGTPPPYSPTHAVLLYLKDPQWRFFHPAQTLTPNYTVPAGGRFTLGQVTADLRGYPALTFADRFASVYMRMYITNVLQSTPATTIDSYDQDSLRLAQISLSTRAQTSYKPIATQALADRTLLLNQINFADIVSQINKALADLASTTGATQGDLDFLNTLSGQLNGLSPAEIAAAQAARDAAQAQNRALTIQRLSALRTRLWLVQDQIKSDIQDLQVELSLLQG